MKRKAKKANAVKRKAPRKARAKPAVKSHRRRKAPAVKEKSMSKKRKRRTTKAAKSPARRRRRKKNPATSVLAVNPAPKKRRRHKSKRRANPARATKRRRHKRRKNPVTGILGTLAMAGIGMIGAGASVLAGIGIDKTALSPTYKAVAKIGAGFAGALPLAFLSPAAAIGFGAGLGAQGIGDGYRAMSAPAATSGSALAGDGMGALEGAESLRERLLQAENDGIDSVEDLEGIEAQIGSIEDQY